MFLRLNYELFFSFKCLDINSRKSEVRLYHEENSCLGNRNFRKIEFYLVKMCIDFFFDLFNFTDITLILTFYM